MLNERDKEYNEKWHAANTRETGSKSLVPGNVFHFLISRRISKKAIRVCSVKVLIAYDWWYCYSGLLLRAPRRRGLQLVFISLRAKFEVDFHSQIGNEHIPAAIWAWAVPGWARSRQVRVMAGRFCFLLTTPRENRRNYQGEVSCRRPAIALC